MANYNLGDVGDAEELLRAPGMEYKPNAGGLTLPNIDLMDDLAIDNLDDILDCSGDDLMDIEQTAFMGSSKVMLKMIDNML